MWGCCVHWVTCCCSVPREVEIDWAPDKQSHCSPETVWSPIWWYGCISPAHPLSWEHVSLLPVCVGCEVRVTLPCWCFIVSALQISYSFIFVCVYIYSTISEPLFLRSIFLWSLYCLTFYYTKPLDKVLL